MLNLRHVLTIAVTVFVFPGLVTAVHSINFGIARTFVLPVLFRIPVVSMLLRPVAAHFLKGSWTLTLLLHHTSIIRRAFYLGRLTMVVWELAEGAFDAIVSEVSHSGPSASVSVFNDSLSHFSSAHHRFAPHCRPSLDTGLRHHIFRPPPETFRLC